MRRIYFARHGESEAQLTHEFSNRGQRHGLTALGRDQAHALAQQLAVHGIGAIHSSPLRRASETAGIIGRELGLPVEVHDALREYDVGVLEGQKHRDAWRVYNEVLADWLLGGQVDRRIDGGESYEEIVGRFLPYLRQVLAVGGPPLLVIAHGGLYRCVLPRVLVNVDERYAFQARLTNCGLVIADGDDKRLLALSWCGQTIMDP